MYRLLLLGMLFITGPAAMAADLEDLAADLAERAESLAEEAYRGFNRRSSGNRSDVEALFLVHQFSAGAYLLHQMVGDRRPDSELKDAVATLNTLARNGDRFTFGQRQWRDIYRNLQDIDRELGWSRPGFPGRDERPRGATGRMRWRGQVDDVIHIHIHRSDVEEQIISGRPAAGVSTHFTSPLPQQQVELKVNKNKGRGEIEVIQQPSRGNDYTAVIRIRDSKGGWSDYDFELIWY